MPTEPYQNIKLTYSLSLSNNATNSLLDTTYGLWKAVTIGTAGPVRGEFRNWRFVITSIVLSGQNVTISNKMLDASGAWVSNPNAPAAIADGTSLLAATGTYKDGYSMFMAPECAVYLTNGGTGPTTLYVDAYLTNNPNPGV